jgi:hypothetical protein
LIILIILGEEYLESAETMQRVLYLSIAHDKC